MDDHWVELRVHGVSGTPPGSMLDRPHVEQVGGDDESRYFRSVDTAGNELPGHAGQVLEAYHWGRQTSGSRFNALWLFLLPFGMVNAAHYMLPAPQNRPVQLALHATCDGLLRFVGLLLTSMYAFAGGLVLIDLIGWRWAATKDGLLATIGGSWVLGIAVLLSAGLVLLLAFLGRGFRASAPEQVADGPDRQEVAGTPLADAGFYAGDSRARQLRFLHIAAGFLVVAMMAVWVVHPTAWQDATRDGWVPDAPGGGSLLGPVVLVYAVYLWVLVAALVLFFGDPERGTRTWSSTGQTWMGRTWSPMSRTLAPALLALSVGVLALALRTVLDAPVVHAADQRPTSFDLIANYQLLTGVVTLVALLGANVLFVLAGGFRRARSGDPQRHFEPYAYGLAAATVALIGTFIGVGIAAAVTTGVSSLLGLSEPAAPGSESAAGDVTVGTTPMLDRVAYSWGLNAILLVLLFLTALVVLARPSKRERRAQRIAGVYGDPSVLPPRWAKKVRRAVGLATLKNYAGSFLLFFAVVGLVFSGVVAWELSGACLNDSTAPCRRAPGLLDHLSQPKYTVGSDGTPSTNIIGLVGAWLVLSAAGLLLLQSRQAVKAEEKRRALNVIWDVLSFWPQATHPFAPRPYSKRCVQDLTSRIRHHLATTGVDGEPRQVVVCGHSQGSLISFAALLRLEPEERDRVALVTFGSQLRMIFPRAFPAYVNYPAVKQLYDALGGAWVNLYRLTDPLAGPVLSWEHGQQGGRPRSRHFPAPGTWNPDWSPDPALDTVEGDHGTRRCGADWQLADPMPPSDPGLQTSAVAEILGHSWYARNHDWRTCLDTVRRIPPPGDPSAQDVPAVEHDTGSTNGAGRAEDVRLPPQAARGPQVPAVPDSR